MLPLMIVASISFAISKRFERHSMDVKELAKKGHAFTSNKDTRTCYIRHFFDYTNRLFNSNTKNLEKLVDLISHSNQVIFAVVDKDKRLVGVVHFNNIREIIFFTYR
jgi:CIC family chloride channel protein